MTEEANEQTRLIDQTESTDEYEVEVNDADNHPSATPLTGTFSAIFIVVNAAMGAGLLNMPQAFSYAGGIVSGMMIQLGFFIFILSSLVMLGYCAKVYNCATYQEVIQRVCGKAVGTTTECFIILYMFGTSIAMLIIVGDQLDKIIEAIIGDDFGASWYFNRKFTMSLFSVLVILPLCIPKDISFLRYASIVGVSACIYVVVIVVVKYATGNYTPGNVRTSPQSAYEFFEAVPAIFFAYQCHVSSIPVFASLKHKTSRNWLLIISCAIGICFSTYTLTAICGYLTFGDKVSSDVLQSYDASDVSVIIARVAIFVAMLTSYPVVHFCGRAAVTTLLVKIGLFAGESMREGVRRVVQTSTWFGLSLLLALFIPDIGKAIALVGGLAGCFILVFPGLCFVNVALKHDDLSATTKRNLLAFGSVLTIFGCFLFGEITAQAVINNIAN